MRRKAIVVGLSLIMLLGFGGCNSDEKGNKSEGKTEVCKEYKELTLEEKKDIAKKLFEEYIKENKTDIEMVEAKNLKRDPVEAWTDYKINDVEVYKQGTDSFEASIGYDIKFTDESNMWVAGNGEVKEGNWCINKVAILKISEVNGRHIVEEIGNG